MTRIARFSRFARTAVPAALAAALVATAAGCSGSSSSAQRTGSDQAFPSSGATISATPGSMSIQAPGTSLQITGAVVKPGPGGTSLLALTVRNGSTIPEHLAVVTAPDGKHATIAQGGAPAGSVSPAGVLLPTGSAVSIGGGPKQPQIQLPEPPAKGATESLMVEFAVSGLVHLQARVAH